MFTKKYKSCLVQRLSWITLSTAAQSVANVSILHLVIFTLIQNGNLY